MNYSETPSVQIDLNIVKRNIQTTVEALARHSISHRPHIKAHKSVQLAQMQLEAGCQGITCAKLGEAEVMADGGIDDIFVAYPLVGQDKLERYGQLVQRGIKMITLVNSIHGTAGLSELGQRLGLRLPVLIELDGGINRGGLKPGEVHAFAMQAMQLPGIELAGVCCYSGDIYGCKTLDAIRERTAQERQEIFAAADVLRGLGLNPRILSGGSSFSILCPEASEGLTEVRAGNYIFNDNALLSIGMIAPNDCAMRVVATVVALPSRETAILDAGSKTLTSDGVNYREGYGQILEAPNAVIYKLNEEHGYVRCDDGLDWIIGDTVTIIPNHACTVPNLCDEMHGMEGDVYIGPIRVDARGKNR